MYRYRLARLRWAALPVAATSAALRASYRIDPAAGSRPLILPSVGQLQHPPSHPLRFSHSTLSTILICLAVSVPRSPRVCPLRSAPAPRSLFSLGASYSFPSLIRPSTISRSPHTFLRLSSLFCVYTFLRLLPCLFAGFFFSNNRLFLLFTQQCE